ncbi:MAG TPA: PIG-L family deacetylase [Balneolales bacterium]|nr:PIG-L family deacetylase [Balneolales bacterium]
MKVLYIYPHPDDESFGPATVMHKQIRQGHEVYLLTLTKGGATKQRHRLNYSIEQMGEVRFEEMQDVAEVLNLTGMTVLDLPDSGLKDMNPIEIEKVIKDHITKLKPDVVVSYNVDGISGFQDHLVAHAVVKRVYCERIQENSEYPRRLAFYALRETGGVGGDFNLKTSPDDEIDCEIEVDEVDKDKGLEALRCYKTYLPVIEKTNVMDRVGEPEYFEFFREDYTPFANDLFVDLE